MTQCHVKVQELHTDTDIFYGSMLKGNNQLRCPVESVHASLDSFHFYYILIAELLLLLITPPAAGGSMAALSL